jgi:hypothetical protein
LKMLLKKWIGDEGTICVAKDRDHDRPLWIHDTGVHKSKGLGRQANYTCTVTPNILLVLSTELAACHFMAPRNLSSLLDFWQVSVHPRVYENAGAITGGDFEELSNYWLLKDSALWMVQWLLNERNWVSWSRVTDRKSSSQGTKIRFTDENNIPLNK